MKILITYAYAGVGHKKAALAVEKALRGFNGVDVETVDILDYTPSFFRFLYPRLYLFLINRVPLIWGLLYYLLDCRIVDFFVGPVRRFFHNIHARKFKDFIVKEEPDVVLSTHFFPSEIVSTMKKNGLFKGKLVTAVTDFIAHSFWLARASDYFIGAIERTKKDLVKRGIKEENIKVFGIPTEPKFSVSKDKISLFKKLDIEEGFFYVLIMGGGFGTGPIRKIVKLSARLGKDIKDRLQFVIICGTNKKLFSQLNRLKEVLDVKMKIFGYMDNIDEFMGVSDLLITKSGGLTVSEALSMKLPMIIIEPIPGQETRNCKVLSDYGSGIRASSARDVVRLIEEFINLPEKMIGMRGRVNLLSYPDAAERIAEFVVHS